MPLLESATPERLDGATPTHPPTPLVGCARLRTHRLVSSASLAGAPPRRPLCWVGGPPTTHSPATCFWGVLCFGCGCALLARSAFLSAAAAAAACLGFVCCVRCWVWRRLPCSASCRAFVAAAVFGVVSGLAPVHGSLPIGVPSAWAWWGCGFGLVAAAARLLSFSFTCLRGWFSVG